MENGIINEMKKIVWEHEFTLFNSTIELISESNEKIFKVFASILFDASKKNPYHSFVFSSSFILFSIQLLFPHKNTTTK